MSMIVKIGKQGKKIIKSLLPAEKKYVGYTRRIERVKTDKRICAMTFDDGPMDLPASPDRFGGRAMTDVLLDTLKEYGAGMAGEQEKIYYAAGETRELLAQTPAVRSALAHGYDVLLCTEDVDEFMFQFLRSYHVDAVEGDSEHKGTEARDLELQNVADANLDLASEDEKKEAEKATEENKDLFGELKDALDEDTPATGTAEGPVSLEMERRLQQSPEAGQAPKASRVLMLNAKHPVFGKLQAAKGDKERLALMGDILYNQALLVEGLPVEDPAKFAREITELM